MFNRDLGGTALVHTHLLRTVARCTDSRKEPLFAVALILACVVNGDSLTSVLRQATWFVVALIVLIIVQVIVNRFASGYTRASMGFEPRLVQ
ncbi:hypothetical protein ACFUCT_30415 [Streptomyces parvus]|uniref:hypothetical protein n=1 Tax=Streptomyces parvus TaxID=66428 RepID=UPI0036328383